MALFAAQMRRAKTPGGAPAWDPTTPGNVVAWYFASTTYCFEDTGGTDACENTDGVAVWKNRNNLGANPLSQSSAGSRPAYESAGWNSANPSVIGTGDVMANTDPTATILTDIDGTDTAFTLFATLQLTSASVDVSIGCWDNSAGNELIEIRTDNGGDNRLRIIRRDAAASSADQTGSAELSTNRKTIAIYFSGTTVTTWINGVMDLNAAALNVGALTTLNRFRVFDGNTGNFTGRISEIAIYTGDKSAHVASYHTWAGSTWGGL